MKFQYTPLDFQELTDFCHCGNEHELDCKAVEAADRANAKLQNHLDNKCKKYYILKADLEHADDACDLGDSVIGRIYKYPHVDQQPDLEMFLVSDPS